MVKYLKQKNREIWNAQPATWGTSGVVLLEKDTPVRVEWRVVPIFRLFKRHTDITAYVCTTATATSHIHTYVRPSKWDDARYFSTCECRRLNNVPTHTRINGKVLFPESSQWKWMTKLVVWSRNKKQGCGLMPPKLFGWLALW